MTIGCHGVEGYGTVWVAETYEPDPSYTGRIGVHYGLVVIDRDGNEPISFPLWRVLRIDWKREDEEPSGGGES